MNLKKICVLVVVLAFFCTTSVFANIEPPEGYYHSNDQWSILIAKGSSRSNYQGGDWIIQIRDSNGNKVFDGLGNFHSSGGTSKTFSYRDGSYIRQLTFSSNTSCYDSKTSKRYSFSYGPSGR